LIYILAAIILYISFVLLVRSRILDLRKFRIGAVPLTAIMTVMIMAISIGIDRFVFFLLFLCGVEYD